MGCRDRKVDSGIVIVPELVLAVLISAGFYVIPMPAWLPLLILYRHVLVAAANEA